MATQKRDVMVIMFEFILSLVVVSVGSFLIWSGKGSEMGATMITAVITFWFTRRQAEQTQKSTVETLMSQQQQSAAPTPVAETKKGDDQQ